MSSRGLLFKLGRHSLRSTTIIVLASAVLALAGVAGLRRVVASHAASLPGVTVATPAARNTSALLTTAGTASGQKLIGVFEGKFDAKSRTVSVLGPITGDLKPSFKAFGRSDANTVLPEASHTRAFMRSCANPSGSVLCVSSAPANTISGEHKITNTGSLKFYNTRLVFTDFLNARGGIPVTANVYFNDGQVPANGKLGVSRDYGDIDAGSSQTRVWSFSFPSGSIQSFYFRFVIYGDIGVAAESVEPAAVQNNTNRTITVNGQGFSSPTVTLLDANGATVATLSSNVVSASLLTAVVPSGTAAGIYSVRVTNAGGTAGGAGSSTLIGKLNVTGVPDVSHTILAEAVTSLGDTGPYLISGNATLSGTVLPGTVVYVGNGFTLYVGSSGLNANGGIPGVPTTAPAQIVFTRSPGATSWGGIEAITAATSEVSFKNCVVEFGGAGGGAQINISGSGRTLRFTDSVSRRSAGAGLKATGNTDLFTGFTRSRIENNAGVAILLSANAALGVGTTGAGMGDLNASNANTRIPDQSYYFSLANVIRNNGTDAVQIDAAANDFTRSGVLVGQGDIPFQIRGTSGNPSVVGNSGGSPGAEVSINPNAIIQLDAGMDFKAGDGTLFGSIGANGYAGYSQSSGGDTGISQRIIFDKIPGGGNFGALLFSTTSSGSSILNFASIRNGGTSPSGSAQVIVDNITYPLSFTNSESNNSSSYGLQYRSNNTVTLTGISYSGNTTGNANVVSVSVGISTLAGGVYGDGNPANQAPLIQPIAFAVDPAIGIYIADSDGIGNYTIRFANTTNSTVKVAGVDVPAKSIKGLIFSHFSNLTPHDDLIDQFDLLIVKNIALSSDRKILYIVSTGGYREIRGVNVTPGAVTNTNPVSVGTDSVRVGRVGTVYEDPATNLGENLRGLAVNPVTGDLYITDSDASKVFKLTPGGTLSEFAGSGRPPRGSTWQPFAANQAASAALINQPEAVTVSDDGNTVYISDSSYARVLRVQGGTANLVTQLGTFDTGTGKLDPSTNPMPSGLTLQGGKLFITNVGTNTVVSINNPSTVSAQSAPNGGATSINVPPVNSIAGIPGTACDFTSSACGDGSTNSGLTFDLRFMTSNLKSDSNGVFVADQLANNRGRIRYLNLSGSPVTTGDVTLGAGTGNTIIGSGLPTPYNGGLATSAILNAPAGVALDSNGNLFIAEANISGGSFLRFVNRGATPVTILGQTVAPGTIIGINKDGTDLSNEESTTPSNAYFYTLQGLKYTAEGLYIVDSNGKGIPPGPSALHTSKLRFLNLSNAAVSFYGGAITVNPGEIKTIAGGSADPGSIGDGNIATNAKLLGTSDVEVDPITKDIYLAESYNGRVRKILRSTGTISSLSSLSNNQYSGLAFDNQRRLLISVYNTNQVLRETAAGSGSFAAISSSGLAINKPRDIAVDSSNNLYVMNSGTQQILNIPLAGGATTVFTGTGTGGFSGDGGTPTSAQINIDATHIDLDVNPGTQSNLIQTANIVIGTNGEVVFADPNNNRIRRVK